MPICPNCGSYVSEGSPTCSCGATMSYSNSDFEKLSEPDRDIVIREIKQDLRNQNAEVYRSKAQRLRDAGKYREAIEEYENALVLKPKWSYVKYDKACTYFEAGMYRDAVEAFDLCNKDADDGYLVFEGIGDSLFNLGEYETAISNYLSAIDNADKSKYFNVKLYVDECEADIDNARAKVLEKMREKENLLAELYLRVGWAYNANGEYEKAIESCETAIGFQYYCPDCWNCKAIALGHLGRFDEALKFYDIALEMKDDKVIRNNRTECLIAYGKAYLSGSYQKKSKYLDEALRMAEDKGFKIYPDDGPEYYIIDDFDE